MKGKIVAQDEGQFLFARGDSSLIPRPYARAQSGHEIETKVIPSSLPTTLFN